MTQRRKIGRNEKCPYGSGQKFKQCCEAKTQGLDRKSHVLLVALASVIAAAILFGIASVVRDGDASGPRRVWSPEYWHYHTIP